MTKNLLLYIGLQVLGILLVPLFDAIIRKTKSFLQGRVGPSIRQTYRDLYKLFFDKKLFISRFTSKLSIFIPMILLAISLVFSFLIPIFNGFFNTNILVLLYLSGLGSFLMMTYAMDNATYFAGLGVAREMFLLVMIEPVLIILVLILGLLLSSTNLVGIHDAVTNIQNPLILFSLIICVIVFRYILLGENKRYPFDNPTTHLELTMIHEAMLLETSGPQLGIMELVAKINLIAFLNLLIFLFLPFTFGLAGVVGGVMARFIKMVLLLVVLGGWEVFITKMRIFSYQKVFSLLLILQLFLLIIYFFK